MTLYAECEITFRPAINGPTRPYCTVLAARHAHTAHVPSDAVGLGQLILEPTCRSILPQLTLFYSWTPSLQSRPLRPFPARIASPRLASPGPAASGLVLPSLTHVTTRYTIWPPTRPYGCSSSNNSTRGPTDTRRVAGRSETYDLFKKLPV